VIDSKEIENEIGGSTVTQAANKWAMTKNNSNTDYAGAGKGATGTLGDMKSSHPIPKPGSCPRL